MKLTVIGCSGSMSGPESPASAYLLQAVDGGRLWSITLDFGPGAMGKLLTHLDPAMLDAMVFSHLHTDHMADIIGMQVYRRWLPSGPLPRIDVFCPGDGLVRTRGVGGDPETETYENEFAFHEISAGTAVKIGPFEIEFVDAIHPVPAVGMKITGPREDGSGPATFFYTGDSDLCEGQVVGAHGVDLLLAESAFEEGRDTVRGIHMTGKRAGELAGRAQVGHLVLTHLQPWTDPDEVTTEARLGYAGPIDVARAGAVYEL